MSSNGFRVNTQKCCGVVLGADILDSTNQNAHKFGSLDEEDTWFELDTEQRNFFEGKRHFNSYLREEYHAIKVLSCLFLSKSKIV